MEGDEAIVEIDNSNEYPPQSIDEALEIIQEAKSTGGEGQETSHLLLGGSMDLDELDIDDKETDDIEISGDFVCAL
ncbi:protein kinase superfamily [Castilleja foliolosa]|uniref:Protein kinase superfamily n=1 Tax=Castilleja foliolosa TaxID=1961234 RepID=A0ABD3CLF9_9LAMI